MMRRARRGERGVTLIELMIAGALLLVAAVGFMATMQYAATANGVAHRRTATVWLRSALAEQLNVRPRSALAAYPNGTWVLETCHDVTGQQVAANAAHVSTFTCPAGTLYRSWLNVVPSGAGSWQVGLYVERTDMGCSAATRRSALGCAAGDLYLTD